MRTFAALFAALLAALCAALSFVSTTSADECPPPAFVTAYRDEGEPFTVNGNSFDTTFVTTYGQHENISFDRNARRIALSGGSGGRLTGEVRVVERFDVIGVPPGTPMNALLTLDLDGFAESACGGSGCGIRFQWWIATATDSIGVNAGAFGPGTFHFALPSKLTLPVAIIAGIPLEVSFRAHLFTPSGSAASAQGVGIYGISGLPPGVHAVTCDGATPVRRSTWGGVKAVYR